MDSICNALCITGYIANYDIRNAKYWVQGDDALIRGRGVDPKDFAEFAQREYGFNAHPDKQLFGHNEADFIQYSYFVENDYLPTYPVSRVGWRMIGQERWHDGWNEYAVIVRALQQMNNAIYNPEIDNLVRWAAAGDSLKLGADLPPREVFQGAGIAGRRLMDNRARWDTAPQASWDVLPIQSVVRKVISE